MRTFILQRQFHMAQNSEHNTSGERVCHGAQFHVLPNVLPNADFHAAKVGGVLLGMEYRVEQAAIHDVALGL